MNEQSFPARGNHPGKVAVAVKMDIVVIGAGQAGRSKGTGAVSQAVVTRATRAVSLGDAETLIQHPASMTHAGDVTVTACE